LDHAAFLWFVAVPGPTGVLIAAAQIVFPEGAG